MGGVEAARHWDPQFDLNGLPRIDLTLHVPKERAAELGFLREFDPALQEVPEGSQQRIVVAVHLLSRPESFFTADPKGKLRFADPVETLLDLAELRLGDQSEALLRRLAPRRTP